ncbi:hypothetical protein HPB51_016086 [Rhipicephalus microplus]|uniref:Uncharacterized protein n=1 Tax=Rhipicephalus microplus TaxID=6941 RepID=A0A9J6DI46_RHIMP|nr:hypothetical protein HPB51_016086 [Rhipicephalus microplus]
MQCNETGYYNYDDYDDTRHTTHGVRGFTPERPRTGSSNALSTHSRCTSRSTRVHAAHQRRRQGGSSFAQEPGKEGGDASPLDPASGAPSCVHWRARAPTFSQFRLDAPAGAFADGRSAAPCRLNKQQQHHAKATGGPNGTRPPARRMRRSGQPAGPPLGERYMGLLFPYLPATPL